MLNSLTADSTNGKRKTTQNGVMVRVVCSLSTGVVCFFSSLFYVDQHQLRLNNFFYDWPSIDPESIRTNSYPPTFRLPRAYHYKMCIVSKRINCKPFPSGLLIQRHHERAKHKTVTMTIAATSTTPDATMAIPIRCYTPPPPVYDPASLISPPSTPRKRRVTISKTKMMNKSNGTSLTSLLIPVLEEDFHTPQHDGSRTIPNLAPRLNLRIRKAVSKTETTAMGNTKIDLTPALTDASFRSKSWSGKYSGFGGLPNSPVMKSDHALGAWAW